MAGTRKIALLAKGEKKEMTMFDSIITEADRRFNLNGKAGTLLSALLALMTDGSHGGFAGFLKRFDQLGLGNPTVSWIGSEANAEISNAQLEAALGADTLKGISNQAGIEYDTATSATAFMTPRVVDMLTPDGIVPQDGDLLSRIGGFLNGVSTTGATVGETFDRIGTAAAPVLDAEKTEAGSINIADKSAYPVGDGVDASLNRANDNYYDDNKDSPLKWLLPLVLLALLLATGYWFCSKSPEPAKTTGPSVNTNAAVTNAVNQ